MKKAEPKGSAFLSFRRDVPNKGPLSLVLANSTHSLPRRLESSSVPLLVLFLADPLRWALLGVFALSVGFADSSPIGRAKGVVRGRQDALKNNANQLESRSVLRRRRGVLQEGVSPSWAVSIGVVLRRGRKRNLPLLRAFFGTVQQKPSPHRFSSGGFSPILRYCPR